MSDCGQRQARFRGGAAFELERAAFEPGRETALDVARNLT